MLAKLKDAFAYCKGIFERCLSEPDVNSRLVFLLGGTVSAVAILILVIAFIHADTPNKASYPSMVLAVGGGSVMHGVSRYFTKKNSKAPTSDGATPDVAPADTGAK